MLNYAINVFREESKAILKLINYLDVNFELAVKAILNSRGRVIITGIGKSGIIGKKISTTLASTGTPSFFLHPSEAYHGDLGMITKDDIIIAITNSGETDEVLKLVPFIRDNKNLLISITGNPASTLAKNSDLHLNIHVDKEVCPLNLAPTTSSTTTMVMGDAIVVALISEKKFKPKDYARFHPGGNLGKRLLLTVSDVMTKDCLPTNYISDKINDIFYSISNGKLGLSVIVDSSNRVLGLITDGELRRTMHRVGKDIFNYDANDLMNPKPKCIYPEDKLIVAEKIMQKTKYRTLLVVNKNNMLIGLLDISFIQKKI